MKMKHTAIIVTTILFFCVPAWAVTLNVNSSTGDDSNTYAQVAAGTHQWQTIGRAAWGSTNRAVPVSAQAAQAGDMVLIAAGTYTTTATDTRYIPAYNPVNSGTLGNNITFQAVGTVTLAYSSGTGPVIGASSGINYITWKGFTIHEANAPYRADTGSIVLWYTTGSRIENCSINGNGDPLSSDNHCGIRLEGAISCTVKNNLITNVYTSGLNESNGAGIMLYNSDDSIIEHNEISYAGSGIFVKGPADVKNLRTIIRYNLIYNTSSTAIILASSQDARVYQNIARDNEVGLRIWYLAGIAVPDGDWFINNTLQNNTIGIDDRGPPYGDTVIIQNNIITDTSYIFFAETLATPAVMTFNYNCYDDYTSAFAQLIYVNQTFTQWKTNYSFDAASIDSDPLFVSEVGDNFKLQIGSPALTIGVDILDLDGDGQTNDTVPAGAYITGSETIGIESSGSTTTVQGVVAAKINGVTPYRVNGAR